MLPFGKIRKAKKEVEKVVNFLQGMPNESLITGYKSAMDTFEKTQKYEHRVAAEIIKKEIERRGLKIE